MSKLIYLERYRLKWKYHQENGIAGGVCDMTILYLFWASKRGYVTNLALAVGNSMFDYNIKQARGYEEDYCIEAGLKRIVVINGAPHVVYRSDPLSLHRAHTLHFQGSAKLQIPHYFSGGPFPGKGWNNVLRLGDMARRRIVPLIQRNLLTRR